MTALRTTISAPPWTRTVSVSRQLPNIGRRSGSIRRTLRGSTDQNFPVANPEPTTRRLPHIGRTRNRSEIHQCRLSTYSDTLVKKGDAIAEYQARATKARPEPCRWLTRIWGGPCGKAATWMAESRQPESGDRARSDAGQMPTITLANCLRREGGQWMARSREYRSALYVTNPTTPKLHATIGAIIP